MNTHNLLKHFEEALKDNNLELINLLKLDADTIKQLKEWKKCRECCLNMTGSDAAHFSYNTPRLGTVNILDRPHKTVIIGAQEWMAENLLCPELGWHYDNDPRNSEGGFGTLHSHFAIPAIQEILPKGWRVPTDEDWGKLIQFVGADACYKLKSKTGWEENGNGIDEFGFRVLPAGYRSNNNSTFSYRGSEANFWNSSANSSSHAWSRNFYYNYGNVARSYNYYRSYGLSIRCVRDIN